MTPKQRKRLLSDFRQYCADKGVRCTAPRYHALEVIALSEKPLSAYEILDGLSRHIQNPKPPTAYRALDFLRENGFIHRIESLQAYVLCETDHKHAGSQFMICDVCGHVQETHLCHIPGALQDRMKEEDFRLKSWNAELHGTCHDCHS